MSAAPRPGGTPAAPSWAPFGRRKDATEVHGAATEAQRPGTSVAAPSAGGRRAPRRAGREQVEQKRAVDAVVPRARAGAGAPRAPAPTCHMSHVTTKSCSWSRCSSPSVTYALAHVTSMLKLRGHAPPCGGPRSEESACGRHLRRRPCRTRCVVAGVRDKVGPQCVTERSTHLLGNALEQPTPTLLCALACHLGQFDRVGGLGTHAGNEPVPAGGGRALGSQPSRLDRESGLGGGSEDALGVVVELVLT